MRIFKVSAITALLSFIFVSGSLSARVLSPGEQAIKNVLIPNVSRTDKRRAGRLNDTAYLYVATDPGWATIFINGRRAGKGTAMLTRKKGSPFVKIKITAPNREMISGWLRLTPKKVLKIRAKMSRKGGNLTILTSPEGANITVDGVESGSTPVTVNALEPGPHMVELHSGEWQWKARLLVKAGKTNVISMEIPEMVAGPPAQVANPAPAVRKSNPEPVTVHQKNKPKPQSVASPAPAPAPAPRKKVDLSKKKPDCDKICNHYVAASGASKTVQDILKLTCMKRCDNMDMPFSICAWKVKSMVDVQKCANLPQK